MGYHARPRGEDRARNGNAKRAMKKLFIAILIGVVWLIGGLNIVRAQDDSEEQIYVSPGPGPEPYQQVLSDYISNLPYIDSIQIGGSNVVVYVVVPDGIKKVTLESRARAGAGAWVPRAVQRIAQAGTLTFQLPKGASVELLRVRGDFQEALPAAFYQGATNFNGPATTYNPAWAYPVNDVDTGTDTDTPERAVVESDIWSIRGHALYYFNQYRGLQIVDLTQPDAPVLRQQLSLPAVGEQMYVLDDNHVLLLVRNAASGQAVVVNVEATPKIVATLSIEGDLQASRMVGTALYIVSQTYRQSITNDPSTGGNSSEWQWGSVVAAFDLATPETPITRDTFWRPGYGNVVTATDQYLLVAAQNRETANSDIQIIDISAPDGKMKSLATIAAKGFVADKFKININSSAATGDILTLISESGSRWGGAGNTLRSVVTTYSLANPAQPIRLGSIEVGHGEGLYATRFDGDRVYLVTYLRVDPLWIVDLKDPANPQLLGELQVPGWSTYIYPLGDHLVTVGIDNSNHWQAAVSLFDVSNPAKPAILGKVPLGGDYSWSEANTDEKAFTVLPDAGLILVPYQGWSTNGWASSVQLIDLNQDSLKARGTIEHSMQPRRATQVENRIISISGRELLVVSAQDRDHPTTTAALELSWAVDSVFVAGKHVIEIENAPYWAPDARPTIRVVESNRLDSVTALYSFTNGIPILGACAKDNRVYVIQGRMNYWVTTAGGGQAEDTNFFLSVFDLGGLPDLRRIGYAATTVTNSWYSGKLSPLWPRPGLLVWVGQGGWGWPFYTFATDSASLWWGGGSEWLAAFDVADPRAPKYESGLHRAGTNGWWNYSGAYTANGLVYLSGQASEFVNASSKTEDGTGIWETHYYLEVIDYGDAANPTLRAPVNIPGSLIGISTNGALLYTKGPVWDEKGQTDWREYLQALAYDGVQAFLVDRVPLATNSWNYGLPQCLDDGTLLLANSQYQASETVSHIQGWKLNSQGKLVNIFSRKMSAPVTTLENWGSLLGVQLSQTIELYDLADPANWVLLGSGQTTGYAWPHLDQADANASSGLYVPLGDYGLLGIPIVPR
jgi:hypothetical protein